MINSDQAPMGDVLDFARKLGELFDVPLVVCERSSGKPEFHYPKGVRDKISSAQNDLRLAQWEPGKAIIGVMGGNVAAVDVDPPTKAILNVRGRCSTGSTSRSLRKWRRRAVAGISMLPGTPS